MRFVGLALGLCALTIGCSAVGTMADTDGDTDTDTDTEGETLSTMSMTSSPPTATNGMSMSGGSDPTTAPVTTNDPTSTTMVDPSTTTQSVDDTSACPPGTEDCPCDVGSTCEEDLMCVDGTCAAMPPCDEPEMEPNNGFDEAIDLGEVACDSQWQTAEGALAGLDADFYTLIEGPDGQIGCFDPDPQALVSADQDVRVCVYMACEDGTGDVNCSGIGPSELEPDTFDDLDGCCGTNEARLYSADCPGFPSPPDPVFHVRVSSNDEEACLPYELEYRMN